MKAILDTKLYIPHLKDELTLLQDWTFDLWHEYRNDKFGEALGLSEKQLNRFWHTWINKEEKEIVTLPLGTVLAVDRIYIRNGGRTYDSITFRIRTCPDKKLNKKRFWVKLEDANQLYIKTPPQLI